MLPKFHCELSGIERVWAMAKRFHLPALTSNVPKSLATGRITAEHHRRMSRKVRDWARAYADKDGAAEFPDALIVATSVNNLRAMRCHRSVPAETEKAKPWGKKTSESSEPLDCAIKILNTTLNGPPGLIQTVKPVVV
jgi:hypothetical protein